MFFLRIVKQKHLFYIIVAEKCLIFKAFSRCCGQHFHCVAIIIPFSAVSPIQYTEGSHRAVEVALGGFFAARKTERRFSLWYSELRQGNGQKSEPLCTRLAVIAIRKTVCCWMTLKCSAEPKRRYVAQIAAFTAEAEPLWRKDRMHPKGQEADFGIVQRRDTLKSLYLAAAFLYALRGASHGIASRDFVCHKSPNHSRNRLPLWGRSPHSPGKERCVWGKIYELPSV